MSLEDVIVVKDRAGMNPTECRSWIHPMLAIHLLMWACPVVASQVIIIFNQFVSGDPDLAREQADLRDEVYSSQVAANENDPEMLLQIESRHAEELQAVLDAAAENVEKLAKSNETRAQLTLDVDELFNDKERLEGVLKMRQLRLDTQQRRVEQQDNVISEQAKAIDEKDEVISEKDDLIDDQERIIKSDPSRPLNIVESGDFQDPGTIERHSVPQLHHYARFITNAIGISFSQFSFDRFCTMVIDNTNTVLSKEQEFDLIQRSTGKTFKAARKRVNKWFDALRPATRADVLLRLRNDIIKLFGDVFSTCDLVVEERLFGMCRGKLWNPVTLTTLCCVQLKRGIKVDYSTEVDCDRMLEIARSFNVVADVRDFPMVLSLPDDIERARKRRKLSVC